jgi:hypothetical protein
MASVRISHNLRNTHKMDWAGAPAIDVDGRLERSLDLPDAVYEAIEHALAEGQVEGTLYLDADTRVQWLADR